MDSDSNSAKTIKYVAFELVFNNYHSLSYVYILHIDMYYNDKCKVMYPQTQIFSDSVVTTFCKCAKSIMRHNRKDCIEIDGEQLQSFN